ncbi:MAG: hypothetical protein KDD39_02945 [Bdellovibrionales bacterium]|nr:hypothetical protein [Bdellovibrionales bacterium]
MKIWLTVGLFVSAFAHALPTTPPLHLMGLSIEVDGWKIAQQARSRETRILRLERAGQSLLFLVDPESEDFSPAAFRGEDPSWLRTHNGLDWKLRLVRAREGALRSVVFATRLGGLTYGGYVSGESEADLTDLVELFLNVVKSYDARSLTTD